LNQEYLRPTDFADLKYCHRLSYINRIHPHNGKTTELTALGKFEHAVFEKYYDLTKLDWLTAGQLNGKEEDSHKSRTSLILDTELKIAMENFPLFADFFEKDLTTLRFRLSKLNHQKNFPIEQVTKKIRYHSRKLLILSYHGKLNNGSNQTYLA